MKILIVRHGDPIYETDSLTKQGEIEAELLSKRLEKLDVKEFYVSVLGRARKTADYTLNKVGRTGIYCDWLQEFPARINKPGCEHSIVWDWMPGDWTSYDEFYSNEKWFSHPVMKEGNVEQQFKFVIEEFDKILSEHGYQRNGKTYTAVKPNKDTIVLFCHFGIECVLLSHLLGISPMLLWHGFIAAPTSITTVTTEERENGVAYFRVNAFGDTSHLYVGGQQPSFSGRFCETFEDIRE